MKIERNVLKILTMDEYLKMVHQLTGWQMENNDAEQILAEALGWYTRFCDDLVNFPGSTPENGYAVGEHTTVTLAMEAAAEIRRLRALTH